MREELSAEDLLARVARQDVTALSELYDRYAPRVFGLISRILQSRGAAEEILQSVFIRLWQEGPPLNEQGRSVAAWLVVTAREAAVDRLRAWRENSDGDGRPFPQLRAVKGKSPGTRKSKPGHHAAAAPKTVEGKTEGRRTSAGAGPKHISIEGFPSAWLPQAREIELIDDRLALLHKAVDQLPKPQRQALELAVFRGMRESEIAAELGEPLGKVRSSLRAAVTYVKHRRRAVCGTWAANI